MKQCPHCNQTYSDDLMYCLSDGSPLVPVYVQPEEPTVVRPPVRKGVSPVFKYLTIGLLLLLLMFAGVVAALLVFWPRPEQAGVQGGNSNERTVIPTPAVSPTVTPTPAPTVEQSPSPANNANTSAQAEKEKARLAEEQRRREQEKKSEPEPPNTPVPPAADPPATRITFGRGSTGESVSGTVIAGRSYVLRTTNGQMLSASVRSENGCVVFARNGRRVMRFPTSDGDSVVAVTNNCDRPVQFRLTVNVR